MDAAFMKLTKAAPVLGVSRQKLKIMAQMGAIPCHKEGGLWLIHIDEAVREMKKRAAVNEH